MNPMRPDAFQASTRFGEFGGCYAPETLMANLFELEQAWLAARTDTEFQVRLAQLLRDFAGRETPLFPALSLGAELGCELWIKREDLLHTGAHKINNALGQALLAQRMGKQRIVAETGAGQHGVATATVCAYFGLPCIVYMGAEDVRRQSLNVFRMRLLGAEVRPVTTGSATLKDAINEALRDWVANVHDTHYVIGSVMGPDPYPVMVRDLQKVIGEEAKDQILQMHGALPSAVVACVGGGSNAIGIFHAFVEDKDVALYGVEASGAGLETNKHAATMAKGEEGIFHGMRSLVLQDDDGQLQEAHSISAGLDYPGVGPEHAMLHRTGRAKYLSISDKEALDALQQLALTEGIIPALESAHAFAALPAIIEQEGRDATLLINLSGRGDKDMHTVMDVIDPESLAMVAAAGRPAKKGGAA